MIKSKKVFVNNVLENKPERHIDENNDIVSLDGVNLEYNKFYYYKMCIRDRLYTESVPLA